MRGWILYKIPRQELGPNAYEMRRFLETAEERGIDLRVVTQEQVDLIVAGDDRKSVRLEGEIVALPDFILPRRGAGTTYFCLAVIRQLERMGVYSVNRSSSIEIVKDKLYTQQILAESKLPFAKTMLVRFPIDVRLVESVLGFPVIVKTVSGSQGRGVFLAETRRQFEDLMHLISVAASGVNVILQEFIETSFGRDLRVITVGGKAVACMQRTAPPGAFKANYSGGASVDARELTPEIQRLSTEASRIFDLDVAGVDLLFDREGFKICEVNSSPGFEGMESCHPGLSMADEIYRFVRNRLKLES
jgi:gamma-F420-2:alpha-L-glutamate ligase